MSVNDGVNRAECTKLNIPRLKSMILPIGIIQRATRHRVTTTLIPSIKFGDNDEMFGRMMRRGRLTTSL